jgi:hypothetical protein
MRDLFLTQSGYEKNVYEHQNVSIAIRCDGFSFIISTQANTIVALCYTSIVPTLNANEYEQALRTFLQHSILQQSFDTCSILYSNQAVSIIPTEFHAAQHAHEIFTVTQPCAAHETVESYQLKNCDATVLYALPQNIVTLCNEELHTLCKFYPQAAPFIEKSLANNTIANQKTIYILLESYYCDIVVTQGKKLELYNNFSFRTVNDFVYVVLNVCKQVELDPHTTTIVLSGKISENSNYCKALQLFAPLTSITNQSNCTCEFPFNPVLYSVFSNLISLNLCE